MTRTEGLCMGAAVALHAAVITWLPMPFVAKPDSAPLMPPMLVTLLPSATGVMRAVPRPEPPARLPALIPRLEKVVLDASKPLVDRRPRPSILEESSAPTVSGLASIPVSGATGEAGASAALGTPAHAIVAAPAAGPLRAPTPLETARPDHSHNPPPEYPALARRFGLSGRVILRVLVEAGGDAKEVLIAGSSGHDVLDQAALRSVRSWRFVPARRGADTIAAWVEFPVRFELAK